MDQAFLVILLKNVIIPEILTAYKAFRMSGKDPTDEEIIATLNLNADRFTAIGQKFLTDTKPLV